VADSGRALESAPNESKLDISSISLLDFLTDFRCTFVYIDMKTATKGKQTTNG